MNRRYFLKATNLMSLVVINLAFANKKNKIDGELRLYERKSDQTTFNYVANKHEAVYGVELFSFGKSIKKIFPIIHLSVGDTIKFTYKGDDIITGYTILSAMTVPYTGKTIGIWDETN